MTSNFLQFVSTISSLFFQFFTKLQVPGLDMSFGTLAFGLISFPFVIWVVVHVLNIGILSIDHSNRNSNRRGK